MSNGKTGPKAIEAALERFAREHAAAKILTRDRERAQEAGTVPVGLLDELERVLGREAATLEDLREVVRESVVRRSRCGRRRKGSEAPEADAGDPEDLEAPEALSACPHGRRAGECGDCDVEGDRAFDAAREDRLA